VKVLVDRLTTTPDSYRWESRPDWLAPDARAEGDPEPDPAEPPRFDVRIHVMGEDLYVDGEARGAFLCACSRCLTRYRHALREPLRIVLQPAAGRVPSDPEGAAALAQTGVWLGDELDAGWYDGSEIDLSRYLQEVVALGLPVQPLCREDCLGLCPRCGLDRNTETCSCEEARPSSPFAVLKELTTDRGD
jgi:uncharacterized protein